MAHFHVPILVLRSNSQERSAQMHSGIIFVTSAARPSSPGNDVICSLLNGNVTSTPRDP